MRSQLYTVPLYSTVPTVISTVVQCSFEAQMAMLYCNVCRVQVRKQTSVCCCAASPLDPSVMLQMESFLHCFDGLWDPSSMCVAGRMKQMILGS